MTKVPKISKTFKEEATQKANDFVESFLKPNFILPPPKKKDFSYIVDIYIKWWRSNLYFCSKYHSPQPNAISPYFEDKFVRLAYLGGTKFAVSYMRHTDEWCELGECTLEECLEEMKEEPLLQPGI